MADYTTSTQRNKWILTPSVIEDRRAAANARASESLRRYGTTKVEPQADGSAGSFPSGTTNGESCVDPDILLPEPLTTQDESVICKFYEIKIQQVCEAFTFPIKIQATAIFYFKRFYLQWSVMEQDAKHIMLTCIYVALKVEEVYVSAEEFGKGIQQDPQVVLYNELTVLQTLEFELITYSSYRSILGFLTDLAPFRRDPTAAVEEDEKDLKVAAYVTANSIMLTDAPLLYPPGQLALAALLSANINQNKLDFDGYLKSLVSRQGRGHSFEELSGVIQNILQMVENDGKPTDDSVVRKLDRQLKYCRNPGLLQEEQRKRERKEKQKLKRASHDVKSSMPPASTLENRGIHDSKRRKSADVIMG